MPTLTMPADQVRALMHDALVAHGASDDDAAIQAGVLLEAELRGHPSHGLRRIPVLVGRLDAGLIVSGAAIEHEWVGASSVRIDGGRGFGTVVAMDAVRTVVDRATQTGIAVAGVHNANHVGMLSPYVELIADAGCAGIALTVSEALVHPWGGAGAALGTNPIGIAVPTAGGPLVLDMSTAAVSRGKVNDYAARGEPLPEGWAVDAAGAPTTDGTLAASISPFGGAKGYGLGLAIEVLVAALTGSALGTDVTGTLDVIHPPTKGDVFMAISLQDHGQTATALARYLDAIRASGPDVAVPGDRARRVRTERLADGIPIDAALVREVEELRSTR